MLAVRTMQGHSTHIADPLVLGWVKLRYEQSQWGFHFTTARAYRSIREYGIRPGRDCQNYGDNRQGRPDVYMSGQFRGFGGNKQTLPPYDTTGELVVAIQLQAAMEDAYTSWLTPSNAIISQAPILPQYIGQIIKVNARDPNNATWYHNMKMIKWGADKEEVDRGEKRSDSARGDPGSIEESDGPQTKKQNKPQAIRLLPREQAVVQQRARGHASLDSWHPYMLDNSLFSAEDRVAVIEVPIRRSLSYEDTDPNWSKFFGEVLRAKEVDPYWVEIRQDGFGVGYLPRFVKKVEIIKPIREDEYYEKFTRQTEMYERERADSLRRAIAAAEAIAKKKNLPQDAVKKETPRSCGGICLPRQ